MANEGIFEIPTKRKRHGESMGNYGKLDAHRSDQCDWPWTKSKHTYTHVQSKLNQLYPIVPSYALCYWLNHTWDHGPGVLPPLGICADCKIQLYDTHAVDWQSFRVIRTKVSLYFCWPHVVSKRWRWLSSSSSNDDGISGVRAIWTSLRIPARTSCGWRDFRWLQLSQT
jgi:hypothetical protein